MSRVTSEPSAFTAYISQFPSRFERNTIRRQSGGDHLGLPSSAGSPVRRVLRQVEIDHLHPN